MDGVGFLCVLLLVEIEEHPVVYQQNSHLGIVIAYHLATLTLTCSALESSL